MTDDTNKKATGSPETGAAQPTVDSQGKTSKDASSDKEIANLDTAPVAPGAKRRARRAGFGGVMDDANEALAETSHAKNARMMAALAPPLVRRGAPVKYRPEMAQRIYQMFCRTDIIFTKKIVCYHLGIDQSTLNEWRHIYPDISQAIAQGLAVQEAYLASHMGDGIKYSQSLYAVMKNLHDWKDKSEETHKVDFAEAMKRQAESAKRVVWDKPTGIHPVIDTVALPEAAPLQPEVQPGGSQDV